MKIVSILGVCAVIAGASAYAMYSHSDSQRGCSSCRAVPATATVEPCCSGHDSDATTCEVATKASCCPTDVCCPTGPCCDASLAVAGPAAVVSASSKVSATVKTSCCDSAKVSAKAADACCPIGACCDASHLIECVAGFGTATKTAK